MKTRIKSNSEVIVSAILRRGLTNKTAAEASGIDTWLLSRITNADLPISQKTAGKLVAVFGSDAVTIAPAAQEG